MNPFSAASAIEADEPAGSAGKRLGYLCGAPRVSIKPEAQAGGPRSHVLGVIGGFRDLGWQVHPFLVGDRMPAPVVSQSEGFVTRGGARALLTDCGRIALRHLSAYNAWAALGGRVDWVYERYGAFQALGKPFQRRGIPWILETQSLMHEEAVADRNSLVLDGMARRLEYQSYRECDVIICVTEVLRELLVDRAKIDPTKLLVVPNGVDTCLFNPGASTRGPRASQFTIGFVGILVRWQRLDVLFRAVRGLQDRFGLSVNVVVIGDGPERRALGELAMDLGLDRAIRFEGRVEHQEVPGLLLGCDVCYSGYSGTASGLVVGSPLKLYEYMAVGRPVVSSAIPEAKEILQDGVTGYLFMPGDVASLEHALSRSYAERDRLPSMGDRARQQILQGHSWTARARQIADGVSGILARRSRD